MRIHHLPPSLAVALALAFTSPAEAREERVVAIGSHELKVALADGDCFFDAEQPGDRHLIDQVAAGLGGKVVLLVAFADCGTLEGWRTGTPSTVSRFGYVMIADAHLEPVFAFDQAALADAITKALDDLKTQDYRADINRLAADIDRIWPTLPAGGQQELGIVHRDRFGPVLATVLSVAGPSGPPVPRLQLRQSVLVAGKVLGVAATRDYTNAETVFDVYGDLSAVVEATSARN
ncbi:hypothetical protein [Thalassobaculum sp.]|uniref:hypothetical protein n=1 Tax=Thalassobaculum sp. TaxID=2022740 RepID=UPI0032EBDCF4